MVETLWNFLRSSPETSIPFPWERCFDVRLPSQVLFYKNMIDGSMVVDLRSQVNLGGGLFHISNMWQDLTGHSDDHRSLSAANQDNSFLISASCCGPLVYLLVPEMVHRCPLCDSFVFYIS